MPEIVNKGTQERSLEERIKILEEYVQLLSEITSAIVMELTGSPMVKFDVYANNTEEIKKSIEEANKKMKSPIITLN